LKHGQHLFNVTLWHCQISFVQFVSCGSRGSFPRPWRCPADLETGNKDVGRSETTLGVLMISVGAWCDGVISVSKTLPPDCVERTSLLS
jgi:hypothetical protein